MTDFQRKAIIALAQSKKNYEDANPDVGMGPWPFMFIEAAAKQLDVPITHEEAIIMGKELTR